MYGFAHCSNCANCCNGLFFYFCIESWQKPFLCLVNLHSHPSCDFTYICCKPFCPYFWDRVTCFRKIYNLLQWYGIKLNKLSYFLKLWKKNSKVCLIWTDQINPFCALDQIEHLCGSWTFPKYESQILKHYTCLELSAALSTEEIRNAGLRTVSLNLEGCEG